MTYYSPDYYAQKQREYRARRALENNGNDYRAERAAYQRTKKRAAKDKLIELKGGCCFDCKQSYHRDVYDLHHLNPEEKEHNIGKLLLGAWENVLIEVEKCVLLCSNCHRIRHSED